MYLKKIIAQGFKSFADNTIIDLENNITGIVGPNGSGKSNVVDAIRWVLGEQSSKALRGDGSMTDIIFSGSKSRNEAGVSSVSLVFDNTDRHLDVEFDEVVIKRKLYKDGTNEISINDEKVRYKDVSNLFIDSGAGKESFNVIEQGKIDEILSNKPSDRRTIFEEAAGVLKYKKRKDEALRKLEKTHNNMNRVNDIIKELEVQVEPLREQKIKALEYFELSEDLKKLEIAFITHDITTINNKFQENKKKIELLNDEISLISTNNSKHEAKIEEYKVELQTIMSRISDSHQELLKVTEQAEKINSQKEIILERKTYQTDDIKLHNNILELKETELSLMRELTTCESEIDKILEENVVLTDSSYKKQDELNNQKNDKANIESKLTSAIREEKVLAINIEMTKNNIETNASLPFAVRNVLNNPKLKGIHNTIGKSIETDEKYLRAIDTVLGAASHNIIVDNEKSATDAINYLKNNNAGRATFFPISVIKERYVDEKILDNIKNENGFIDVAANLVTYNEIYKNIIKNQLGHILVVDDLASANKISKKIEYKNRIVTLDGEIIHVGGSLTGGGTNNKKPVNEKYELEKLISEHQALELTIRDYEEKINTFDKTIKSLEDELFILNKDVLIKEEVLNDRNKRINDLQEKLENTKKTISGTNNILENSLDQEEEQILKEYYEALSKKDKIVSEIDGLTNDKARVTNELETFEHSVKKDNSLYTAKNQELKDVEIDVNRSDVKLDNLLNTLSEEYNMTYEYAVNNYSLEIDPTVARSKVLSYKRRINELGPINATAPEEYDRISGRYEFLIMQHQDLIEAENTLLEIIGEMDKIMEINFKNTFQIINENFIVTFKELFKGGSASLKLTDPNNLLETGIEIIASPPGKTLKSTSLLSGGEKTLTAICLLFAILKSRPVPFCVLDEVEAALDEVNVESFGEYIQKFKKQTQFLIITHKKKTMEYVDTLYGITMQESGVSKLVSVKLEEIESNKK